MAFQQMQKDRVKLTHSLRKLGLTRQLSILFNKIIFSSLNETHENDIDAQRLVLVINLYCIVGTLYLIFFSIQSFITHQFELTTTLALCAFFAIGNSLYLHHTGNYRRAGDVVVVMTLVLFLYLISTGGVDNTGPLWSYTLPPLVLFIYGLRKGGLVLSSFILISMFLMFFPDNGIQSTNYSYNFKVRYFSTFLGVCLISSICEYSRYHSNNLLKKLQKSIQLEAHTDVLTNLYNRRYMHDKIDKLIHKTQLNTKPCSILLCDLDHFKSINDNYGHPCGDQVLIETATRMKNCLRSNDIAARWGGEEFMIILPETNQDAAFLVAEKLRKRLCEEEVYCSKDSLSVSMSIGMLQITTGYNLEDILNNVDDALYAAKRNGRNCTQIYNHSVP